MADKQTSFSEFTPTWRADLGDWPSFLAPVTGTLFAPRGKIPQGEHDPGWTLHLSPHGEILHEDSNTLILEQDEVIRQLVEMLTEARRNLEALLRVEAAEIPNVLELNPSRRERSRIKIGKVERAKFQFIEDD
jgi:hypothetical protein